MAGKDRRPVRIVGWRERIDIPELGLCGVRAKVDTGARTSCLHADDVEFFTKGAKRFVRFGATDDEGVEQEYQLRLKERRWITSSNGGREHRPVVGLTLVLGGLRWKAEVTLTSRSTMGFPMLLGREALRGRFLIDPDRSFVQKAPRGPNT